MVHFKILFFLIIFIQIINIKNEEVDECLYAIQRDKDCFKIPKNDINGSCCYLEMDLNKITTTACIRVHNNGEAIEKRIFQIKENEENYTLENLKIQCFSNFVSFSFFKLFIKIIFFSL